MAICSIAGSRRCSRIRRACSGCVTRRACSPMSAGTPTLNSAPSAGWRLRSTAIGRGLTRAVQWGLAMRRGQRLSGGVAGPLERSKLGEDGAALTLHLAGDDAALYGEAVQRRHATLAAACDRKSLLTS